MSDPDRAISMWEKLAIVAPFMLVNSGIYMYLNHFPTYEPQLLPMLAIDRAIPFMAWTIWPYTLLMAFNVTLPFLIEKRRLLYQTLRAYVTGISINVVVWMAYPTTYPRPPLPNPTGLSEAWYLTLMSADNPTNCFPSGHITIPTVMVWALSRQWPKYRTPMWIVLVVLSLTILTTKQHYFWDLPAGFVTAGIGIAISEWWERRRARD